MSKATKITAVRVARQKAKAGSLANSTQPKTRRPDGSIRPKAELDAMRQAGIATSGKGETKAPAGETKRAKTETPSVTAAAASKSNGGHGHAASIEAVASLPEPAAPAKPIEPTQQLELLPVQRISISPLALGALLAIAPTKEARPYLNGVFFHQTEDRLLRMVAVDGTRMLVVSEQLDQVIDWAQAGAIIPTAELARIAKYFGRDEELAIDIDFGVHHPALTISAIGDMASFKVRPVEGSYPNYQAVIDLAAGVFGQEREEMEVTTFQSEHMKAAGMIASKLGSQTIIPFLSTQDGVPSVFAFGETSNALLYVGATRAREQVLPPATVKLFGDAAVLATIAKLEAAAEKSREVAARCKRDHFRETSTRRAERLQARADELRANLSRRLDGPKKAPSTAIVARQSEAGVTLN